MSCLSGAFGSGIGVLPMGVMDRDCAVCLQAIADGERWFRVREEYVHLSCSEKYLRVVSERRQNPHSHRQQNAVPRQNSPIAQNGAMEEETQKPISAKSTADLRVVEAADSHFYGR
jgi:hypothetical protein